MTHNGTSFLPLKWYLRFTFQRSRGLPRRTLLVSSEYENINIILYGMAAHLDNSCSPSIVTVMSMSHQTTSGNHPFHPRLSPLLSSHLTSLLITHYLVRRSPLHRAAYPPFHTIQTKQSASPKKSKQLHRANQPRYPTDAVFHKTMPLFAFPDLRPLRVWF
jgi:hypothetical protein